MLSASLAVLCWVGLAAADPTGIAPAPESRPAVSPNVPPTATGTLQFEFEVECCDGLEALGRTLFSTVCFEGFPCQSTGACQTQSGVARSACGQCISGCCTTASGGLLQATCIAEGQAVQVHQACPAVSGAVINITGTSASLNGRFYSCPTAAAMTGDGGEASPWVAEGACHVRELGVATSVQRPMLRIISCPCEPVPFHQTTRPSINAFIVPASAPQDVLYTTPAQQHPAFVVSNTQNSPGWIDQPAPSVDERGRITHLHEAARHLEAAGMHGEANQLRQRAQEMEHHTRRMLEEKEAQLRHLQQEIEVLRQALGHDHSQTPVSIHSDIFRVSPQGLEALRQDGHGFGAGSVNRHDFRQLMEKLQQAGMAEVVARPQFVTTGGQQAAFQCRLGSERLAGESENAACDMSIRPILHDGCCRLEVQPQLRTTTAAGLRIESAQFSADLDPSQGLLAELTDDGSLLAFITWEHAIPPQPTAAEPPPVMSRRMQVPASAEIHQSSARLQHFHVPVPGHMPQSGQIIVTPVFPQPFPARVPQYPAGLQVPPPPIPAAELVPPSPVR